MSTISIEKLAMTDISVISLLLLGTGLGTGFGYYMGSSSLPLKIFQAWRFLFRSLITSLWWTNKKTELDRLAESHEIIVVLEDLIREDGAGAWPPNANHSHATWPEALKPFKETWLTMAPWLASAEASLDDAANRLRIDRFRSQFRQLLKEKVDLIQVRTLLENVDHGRWDVVPRDTYNAFYCCIASCRHAYR